MEEAVRRARDRRPATTSDHRSGEREAQAAGRRPEPGQEDAAGRALKKTLRPAVQRVLVQEVQVAYRESRTSNLSGVRVFQTTTVNGAGVIRGPSFDFETCWLDQ